MDIGILDSFRQHNAGEHGLVRIQAVPAHDVAHEVATRALAVRRVRRTGEGWSDGANWASVATAGAINRVSWAIVNYPSIRSPGRESVKSLVERVVRRVPTGVAKRVIQRSLKGDAITAAQRSLAIAEDIPGKADPRPEVIVVALAQVLGCGKTARPADPSQHCRLVNGRITCRARGVERRIGIMQPSSTSGYVVNHRGSRPLDEGGRQVVLLVVALV